MDQRYRYEQNYLLVDIFFRKPGMFFLFLSHKLENSQSMKTLIFSFLFFVSFISMAQDWSTDTYKYDELYPGYVVTLKGEKIEGYIKYRNRFIMQEEVIFFSDPNMVNTKKRYKAEELLEYEVADKHYEVIRYSGGKNNYPELRGNLVMRGSGCIKEYVWYSQASGYTTMAKLEGESDEAFGNRKFPSTPVFYKAGDEIAVEMSFFQDDFAKKVSQYVSGNKELAKKVKSGMSGYNREGDVRKIFEEYNKDCK